MNLLVTGPTGFIGRAVLRRAVARGHAITALVLPGEALPEELARREGVRACVGTLAEPPWEELAATPWEACLHTAWITTPGVYLESPENERLLEWSRHFARAFFARGGRHFMGLGSCAEYRPARQPLAEESAALNEATLYARCKNQLRLALEDLAREFGGTACWGRVFYPFGPGEHPERLCSALIRRLARGEAVTLKTPESTKDYIYIDDLALAIVMALEQRCGGPLNLGTGRGVTVRQMAEMIAGLLGRTGLVREAAGGVADPLDYMVADVTRLRGLGWREEVGLEEGLRRLCRHLTG
ncbi:MAG: NAD(P)-dependent oxidoreductase [Verrucomicrobiae bacterium]|nr:NAD(P)-dependent oxidoreductase [Verrucomicrobiae bacterium]